MKTNFSRIGKKTLSIVIAMMMVISTMLVGTVTTNAATAESDSVGTGEYYLWHNNGVNSETPTTYATYIEMNDAGNGKYTATIPVKQNTNFYFLINTSTTSATANNVWSSAPSITKSSDIASWSTGVYDKGLGYIKGYCAQNVKVVFDSSTLAVDLSAAGSESTYTVNKGTPTNGSFTVDKTSAAADATITVTPSPADGYEVDTVKYTYGTTTADATKQSDGTYTFSMPASDVTVNVTFKETTSSDKITVYFDNSTKNWSTVFCYAWYGTNTETVGKYPGKEMTKVTGSDNVYSIELPSESVNCIFSNNGSTSDKTKNLTIQAGKMYKPDTDTWVDYGTTPTTTYYIGGRFRVKDSSGNVHTTLDGGSYSGDWNPSCTDSYFTFKENPSVSGEYILETNMTTGELSATVGTNKYNPYFIIHKGEGTSDFYGRDYDATTTLHECQLYTEENVQTLDSCQNGSNAKQDQFLLFSDNDGVYDENVTLHFNPSTMQFWFTSETPETKGNFTIADKTDTNGKLSFSAPGRTAGSANAGDTVTITGTPLNSYFELSKVKVSYKVGKTEYTLAATKSETNKFTFEIPAELDYATVKDATISVKGTFVLTSTAKSDYVKAQGNGLYIDVAPTKNDTTATLIKWNNYKGKDHGTTSNYTFYVPKNVDLSNAVIYNTTGDTVTLGGKTISNNDKAEGVNLTVGDNTITGGSVNNVKVMQGSTDAMFLYTTNKDGSNYDLPTARRWPDRDVTDAEASAYKDTVKSSGGNCITMNNDSEVAEDNRFSAAMGLDSVKGRGNSSWKASATMFGKYAFNMKLKSKTNLLGMDSAESSGAKSWCLLANNADQSMLRNAMTYQLAAQIGLLYSPEFRFVDIYDNSEYMGSYLVTEKVDVGGSKLVKGTSFEDLIEDVVGTVNEEYVTETKDGEPSLRYAKVTADGSTNPSIPVNSDGKYLLEFELKDRVTAEASFFRSNKGQYVVVKSPEFATKEQVEYVRDKFNAMEAIVYNNNATKDQLSTVIDVESFAKMYLIQEFSSNLDSAATSYYVTLDCTQNDAEGNGAVFVANPVWDYDWAYGQYKSTSKEAVTGNESPLVPNDPEKWYAKAKKIGDNELDEYSIQSQLANNNPYFKTEVRKQWESNSSTGFYKNIQNYYAEGGQLDTWKSKIEASINMNETRWGFIAENPLSSWGSNNAITSGGSGFDGAVKYLKNDWTAKRAAWLNTELQKTEYVAFVPVAPTAAAYTADETQTLDSVPQGTPFVIKAASTDNDVVFRLFKDGEKVGTDQRDGVFAISTKDAAEGPITYVIKAVYTTVNGTETVSEDPNAEVTVTITPNTDIKTVRIYFKSASASVYVPSLTLDGSAAEVMTRIKKGEEGSTYFGENYSGSLKFYWFYLDKTINTAETHTVKFTTKENRVDASMTLMLNTQADDKYYFAVDNLMGGDTTLVNLTGKPEYIRNWHISATHMVHSTTILKDDGVTIRDNGIGFTWKDGQEYAMGSIVNANAKTVNNVNLTNMSSLAALSTVNPKSALTALSAGPYFTIKSATLAQQITAGAVNVSELQYQLLDVNLDGVVNVKDATMMQKALASF